MASVSSSANVQIIKLLLTLVTFHDNPYPGADTLVNELYQTN